MEGFTKSRRSWRVDTAENVQVRIFATWQLPRQHYSPSSLACTAHVRCEMAHVRTPVPYRETGLLCVSLAASAPSPQPFVEPPLLLRRDAALMGLAPPTPAAPAPFLVSPPFRFTSSAPLLRSCVSLQGIHPRQRHSGQAPQAVQPPAAACRWIFLCRYVAAVC